MTEDRPNDENAGQEDNPANGEKSVDDVEEYVLALNRFVHLVEQMEWPEHFRLVEDKKQCFDVFRSYWRQRHRQRREKNERRERHMHMRFQGMSKEDVHRFFRQRFNREYFGEDDQPGLNIDPNGHEPDEEHTEASAKERQRRFRDEWA